mgnify:CR=1 FL=1
MNFTELFTRLLNRLRRLADSGTITESALARRLGVSQSHLHNTLKGVRGLTVSMADQILASMQWNIWDLCSDLEIKEESAHRKMPKSKCKELSVRPLSHLNEVVPPALDIRVQVPRILLTGIDAPALLAVTATTDTTGLAEAGDILLADLACSAGQPFAPDAVYLFLVDGQYTMRWARKGSRCTYLVGTAVWMHPLRWQRVESAELIGRVRAIAKRQSGMFQRPAPPSGAS